MIDVDGIQIEERELAELLKKLYISYENNEESEAEALELEGSQSLEETAISSDIYTTTGSNNESDFGKVDEAERLAANLLTQAKKEAEELIAKAQKEREDILEQSRKSALKEAEDIKAEALFQKGKLKEQELFFEKKMVILKAGFAQLEADKKAFEKEKREDLEKRARANSYSGPGESATMLFAGVNNLLALKKRYKDLIKIFHPDNLCGDTEVLQLINREYEKLMDEFGWVRKAY